MTHQDCDLTIEQALIDPMIRAAMRADRIDPSEFEALLRSTALELSQARRARVRSGSPVGRSISPIFFWQSYG